MSAVVAQDDGLQLSIAAEEGGVCPLLDVGLRGSGFQAHIRIVHEPLEGCVGLAEFFLQAAQALPEEPLQWRSACLDLALQVTAGADWQPLRMLKVSLWSTADDASDWHVNASLLLSPEQLRRFAGEVLAEMSAPML